MTNQTRYLKRQDAYKAAKQMNADEPTHAFIIEKVSDHHYYIIEYDDMGERVGVKQNDQ